jgi:hypothetical protein
MMAGGPKKAARESFGAERTEGNIDDYRQKNTAMEIFHAVFRNFMHLLCPDKL